MEIRPATAADRSSVERLVAAAFGEEDEDGRVVTMMRALAAGGAARLSLVAVTEGRIVGHVGLSRGWVDARPELLEVLVLSPLSVAVAQRRRGVGTALVAAALAAAREHDVPAVFLEGSWTFYGRRGFRTAAALGFERPSTRIPERAFQVALLPSWERWMVGSVVYPEAFWTTGTVGLRDPDLAAVEARATSG